MSTDTDTLHGSAPDHSSVALLLIDLINDLDFDEGRKLLEYAIPVAERVRELKRRAKEAGIPVIYVNDNFGRWQSDFSKTVDHVLHDGMIGEPLAKILVPEEDDYFVLKPKHSGFFSTTLDTLLEYLGAQTLILTGIAGNICVLFTANDAYMRDFKLYVPRDCTASNTEEENEFALDQMAKLLKAETAESSTLDLTKMIAENG